MTAEILNTDNETNQEVLADCTLGYWVYHVIKYINIRNGNGTPTIS